MKIAYNMVSSKFSSFISKICISLIEHIRLMFGAVPVNAYIYYDCNGNVRHENWGDDINYYFLHEIIKKPIVLFNRTSLAFRLKTKNYIVIGSTIDMLGNASSEVWGAGIINGDNPLPARPKKVHAVRGPLTRQKLISEGVDCPEIYGDPALLIPRHYLPQIKKQYKYGFISHVSNRPYIEKMTINGVPLCEVKDVLLIDMGNYTHWHDIIDQICSCKAILSSSLHGLIVAEAYNIPNVWLEFGKPLIGGHFKFHDFFLSINRDRKEPIYIEGETLPIEHITEELNSWKQGEINTQQLLDSCPFPLSI